MLNADAVLIDARREEDYRAGHLEGAISVPVDADDKKQQEAMAGITKDALIIVYCKSRECPYAEAVATRLQKNGFRNLSIFKGGWDEWSAR